MENKTLILVAIATIVLMGGVLTQQQQSANAFSNKYSYKERYDSGLKDGNKDCQTGADTASYQQSSIYLGHSKYYQQGYDTAVANCNGGHGNNNYGYNDGTLYTDSHDRNQAQGQTSTQKPLCVTVFGSCNTTSGQSQGLQN
jgi:uncharacterized membrane protein